MDPSDTILKLKETSPFLHAKAPTMDVLVKVAEGLILPEQKPHRYPMDWCFFEDHPEYLDSELEPITDKRN